jgi:type IV pilus assembly protein PilM
MLKHRRSIVGLDMGASSIKAIEITHDKFEYIITAFGHIDVASEQGCRDALAELFRDGGFRTKRVATSVSGKSVIFRYLDTPRMSDEELRAAVMVEADKYIPFDIEEVQLDVQRLTDVTPQSAGDGEQEAKMKILLAAAKRSLLQDQAMMLGELGLQPVTVGIDSFAIGNAF